MRKLIDVCMYIFIVLLYVYFIDIYFIDVFQPFKAFFSISTILKGIVEETLVLPR